MNLYQINKTYLGKDLDDTAIMGYLIAVNDKDIYKILNNKLFEPDFDEEWSDYYGIKKAEIIKNKGDREQEYMGEFYDIKYSWENLGLITEEEFKIFNKFNLILFI